MLHRPSVGSLVLNLRLQFVRMLEVLWIVELRSSGEFLLREAVALDLRRIEDAAINRDHGVGPQVRLVAPERIQEVRGPLRRTG